MSDNHFNTACWGFLSCGTSCSSQALTEVYCRETQYYRIYLHWWYYTKYRLQQMLQLD